MARRRGFLAEVNRQIKASEQRQRQQLAAANRAQAAAQREANRAQREYDRAVQAMERASAADRKAAEKEAARLHLEARIAEVEALNADLATTYQDIDGLLATTLEVDDYVDLDELKVGNVQHPPFDPGVDGAPIPAGQDTIAPAEPAYIEPPAPTGVAAAFGGKKKHQAAIAAARSAHEHALGLWHAASQAAAQRRAEHELAEAARVSRLAAAQEQYAQDCQERENDAAERNAHIDQLKNNLAFDMPEAIEEYVAIVLSNSVYPESFPVAHQGSFDLATRELALAVSVPDPSSVPTVKEFRYVKAKDDVTSVSLPVKAVKDRYAGAVWQVAVRTLHEVFEADRAGRIQSIALRVGVDRRSPATGQQETVPLVTVAAGRAQFEQFDLNGVVPSATLEHLGAAMSKSPFDLTPATVGGVRRGTAS
jgi:restriction system protein